MEIIDALKLCNELLDLLEKDNYEFEKSFFCTSIGEYDKLLKENCDCVTYIRQCIINLQLLFL